jgi:hypothetical protein
VQTALEFFLGPDYIIHRRQYRFPAKAGKLDGCADALEWPRLPPKQANHNHYLDPLHPGPLNQRGKSSLDEKPPASAGPILPRPCCRIVLVY